MRRSRFARPAGKRRKFEWNWAGLFFQGTLQTDDMLATWARVPASVVDNANSSGIPYVIPDDSTLIRTKCVITFSTDNGGAQVNAPWIASAGLIAWDGTSDDTLDIGVLPSPYWDKDFDWVWHMSGPYTQQNQIAQNGGTSDGSITSKAMRKLSAGTGLLFVFTLSDPLLENIAFGTNLAVDIRMLLKLA